MVNPTLRLDSIVNTIHVDNIITNLNGNSHTDEPQCHKVDYSNRE